MKELDVQGTAIQETRTKIIIAATRAGSKHTMEQLYAKKQDPPRCCKTTTFFKNSLVVQVVENPPAMRETWV